MTDHQDTDMADDYVPSDDENTYFRQVNTTICILQYRRIVQLISTDTLETECYESHFGSDHAALQYAKHASPEHLAEAIIANRQWKRIS